MSKNLLKIISILTLLAIPRNINENDFISPAKLAYKTKTNISKDNLEMYEKNIRYIEERISPLNIKIDFFLERLKERKYSSTIKDNYLKNLREAKKELKEYENKKDSILKLIKN